MIFTLFLICAFRVHNVCSAVGAAACAAASSNVDCKPVCLDYCATSETAVTTDCIAVNPCDDSATNAEVSGAPACVRAYNSGGAVRKECIPACRTFCLANVDTTNCPRVLDCFDAATSLYITPAASCAAVTGTPSCAQKCLDYCVATKGADNDACNAAIPCKDGQDAPLSGVGACDAAIGDPQGNPVVDPKPECTANCRKYCLSDTAPDATKCKALFKCQYDNTDLTGDDICASAGGFYDPNPAPGQNAIQAKDPYCNAPCRDRCKTVPTANAELCAIALTCNDGTDPYEDTEACTHYNGQANPVIAANKDCYAPCRHACLTSPTVDAAKCVAAFPCMSTADPPVALTNDAACVKATTTTNPAVTGDENCTAPCRSYCIANKSADVAKCLAALPCNYQTTALTGDNTCKSVTGDYDPNPTQNVKQPANKDCTAPCRLFCGNDSTATAATCDAALHCGPAAAAALTGKEACTAATPTTGANAAPGDPDCMPPCLTFCKGSSPDATACEGALACWNTAGKAPYAGAAACKQFIASPSVAACKPACDAYCGTDPCAEAKATDCASQCTTWCALPANAESELCPEGEGSSFSVVLSLLLLVAALL